MTLRRRPWMLALIAGLLLADLVAALWLWSLWPQRASVPRQLATLASPCAEAPMAPQARPAALGGPGAAAGTGAEVGCR